MLHEGEERDRKEKNPEGSTESTKIVEEEKKLLVASTVDLQ